MVAFKVNSGRLDPYKNYRFLVYFGGSTTPVAGVSKVTGLKRTTDVIEHKEGGNGVIFKGPGRTKYDAVTLERGVTHDDEFAVWANAAQAIDKGAAFSRLKGLRRNLTIELCNEQGQTVHRYILHNCWVSEYQALPDLDAGGNAIALEHIKVENEGWEHDSLPEPDESAL
jgi:phage tail-like protein